MKVQSQLVGTGKIGNVVYASTAGECVARAYNPTVANPSTEGQVDQRARFKLMSQLTADMSVVIAIPKQGLVSSKNLFMKKNFNLSFATNGEAAITLENVQLTEGRTGLPQVTVTRSVAEGILVELAESASSQYARVVYSIFKKTSEQKLQFVSSLVVTSAGDDGVFPATFAYTAGELVFYAYGMSDKSAKATAKYADLHIQSGTDIASLVGDRTISTTDFTFSETRGTTLASSANSAEAVPDGQARVYVTASGNGTVAGAGTFAIGSQVTVTATPAEGSTFLGWRVQGQTGYVSTSASYTFTLQSTTDLVGFFNTPSSSDDPDEN